MQQFGIFDKVKKWIRPVAKVGSFMGGKWGDIASAADKALTVYDVAKGNQSPLALADLARQRPSSGQGGGLTLGGIGEFIFPGEDDRGLFKNLGSWGRGTFGGDRGDQFNMLQNAGMSPQEIRELSRQGIPVEDQYKMLMQSPAEVGGQGMEQLVSSLLFRKSFKRCKDWD